MNLVKKAHMTVARGVDLVQVHTNFEIGRRIVLQEQHGQDLLKEPLVLEFLGLNEDARYSESDLESAIINHIEKFLLELCKGFLFEVRQKRFTFAADHFHNNYLILIINWRKSLSNK